MVKQIESHKEMAHILGLDDNPFSKKNSWYEVDEDNTGWTIPEAHQSTKNRYEKLTTSPALNFQLLPGENDALPDLKNFSSGTYVGFAAGWEHHGFTIHAVCDGNEIHFLYVNRGQHHKGSAAPDLTVIAFSINKDQADTFLKEMMQAAAHLNRDIFSQFLESHQNEVNRDLSMKLAKSTQKVGNCGIANSNISWHFQLASNYMLEHKTNFATAYEKTKPEYKKIRLKDKIQAFQYLLNEEQTNYSAYFWDYIHALISISSKQGRGKGNYIEELVEAVKDDPKMLKRLIAPLVGIEFENQKEKLLTSKEISSPSLRKEKQQKIDFARDLLLKHAFNKLNPEDQKEMIQKDLELAAYASPDIKKDFILASKKQLDNLLNESGANTSMLTADSDEVQKAIELFMSINKLMEQILVLNINSKSIISRDKLQEALREELKKCHNIDLLNQTLHSFKNTLSELIEVTNEYQQFKLELESSFGLKKTNRIFEEIDKKVMNGDSLLVRHHNLLQQRQVINFDELRSKKFWIVLRMTTIIDIKIDDKSPIDLKLLQEEASIRIQTASSLDEFWDVLNKWEKNLQNVKDALNLYQLNKKKLKELCIHEDVLKAYDSEIMKGGNLTERLTRINNLNSQMSKKAEKLYEKAKKELSGLMEQRNNSFNIAEWQKQMLHEAISSLNQLVKQINKMNLEGKPVIDLKMFQQEKEKITREATSIADLNKKLNQLTEILKAIFTEYQRLRAQLDELGIDGNCRFLKVYEDEVMNGADLTQRLEIIKAQNARCLAVKENMTSLNQLIQKRETRFIIDPSLLANQKKIIMGSGGSIEDVNKQLKSLSVMVETIGQEDQNMRVNLSRFDEKILQMYDDEVTKSDNLAQKLKIITDLKASLARFRETMNRNYLTQDSLRRDIDKIKINDKHIINLDMQETIEPWEDFTSLENYFKSCTETADLSIKRLSLLKEALLKYAELHKQLKDLGFGENDSHMSEFLSGLDKELSSYRGTKQEILDNVVKNIINMRMVILGLESNRVHMQIQALKTHPDNNMTRRIEQIMITLPIEARVTMSKSTDKAMEKILKSNPVPEATASKPSTGPQVTCPTQGVESGLIAIQANENESDAIVSLRQKLIELEQEILNHNFKLHRGGGSPYDNKSPKKFPNGAIEVLKILHKLNTSTPRASTKDLYQGMKDIMDAVQNKQEPVTCTNRFFHGKRDEDTISEYMQIIKTAESAIEQLKDEIYESTAESFKVGK